MFCASGVSKLEGSSKDGVTNLWIASYVFWELETVGQVHIIISPCNQKLAGHHVKCVGVNILGLDSYPLGVPSFDASMSKNTIHINKIRYFTSRPLVELTQTKQWDKENRRYGGWRHEFSFQDTERAAKKETRTWLRGPRKWWLSG